jgi:hypothetical protein
MRCGALGALQALLVVGSELLPLATLGSLQRALLFVCTGSQHMPPPPLHGLALTALHTSVVSGRAEHSDTLPRALAAFHGAAAHGDASARAAAHAALHAIDTLLHPCGVLAWGGVEAGREGEAPHHHGAVGNGARSMIMDGCSSVVDTQSSSGPQHLMASHTTRLADCRPPSAAAPSVPTIAAAAAAQTMKSVAPTPAPALAPAAPAPAAPAAPAPQVQVQAKAPSFPPVPILSPPRASTTAPPNAVSTVGPSSATDPSAGFGVGQNEAPAVLAPTAMAVAAHPAARSNAGVMEEDGVVESDSDVEIVDVGPDEMDA